MSRRYRLTREMQPGSEPITLEECKTYFALQSDFTYSPVYTVTGAVTMSIDGDFFLWSLGGDTVIPFRHYQGDVYVSGSNDAVIPRMIEVASALHADITEG